tara:strand:+ start:192 stop:455 length:264 start_codon:yes stop_codon:yes gene_type:complete
MDHYSLEEMKNIIEKLNKTNQLEFLKMFKDENVKLNENKSGTFINLSFLNENILNKIKDHIIYIKKQQSELDLLESQKKEFQDAFFE